MAVYKQKKGESCYFQITARWNKVALSNYPKGIIDIIQVNNEYYGCVEPGVPNEDVEDLWDLGEPIILDRVDDIMNSGDPYGVLHIIQKRTPDWDINATKCECGSDNVFGPSNAAHSFWCPK